MREFEFILWCEKTNIFSTAQKGLNFELGLGYFFKEYDNYGNCVIHDNCIPMIFLGYTDIKGNKVFQDFILRINRINNMTGNRYTEYVVAPNKIQSDFLGEVVDFEIMGNIHQNPDMLKV